jgi:hypothetical protein
LLEEPRDGGHGGRRLISIRSQRSLDNRLSRTKH